MSYKPLSRNYTVSCRKSQIYKEDVVIFKSYEIPIMFHLSLGLPDPEDFLSENFLEAKMPEALEGVFRNR